MSPLDLEHRINLLEKLTKTQQDQIKKLELQVKEANSTISKLVKIASKTTDLMERLTDLAG